MKGRGYGAIGGAVPTNYIIDKAGFVRWAKAGSFSDTALELLVTPLLAEPAPQQTAAATP